MTNLCVELLSPLIRGMCKSPDELQISELDSDGVTVIVLLPHANDYRILCGKGGRQIRALQFLVNSFELRLGIPMRLELRESSTGARDSESRKFEVNRDFDDRGCMETVRRICDTLFARSCAIHFKRKPAELRIEIITDPKHPEEIPTVAALGDVFYPYGYAQGCIIKIKSNHES
jgi:predicted RNA-binding protein YlqC (UPF0109 family)